MSHVKAGGTAKNTHDSPGQRLGVKRFGGEKVSKGEIILRQRGSAKHAGAGTLLARDHTIHAMRDGVVAYRTRKVGHFSGKTIRRTEVSVE